MEMLLADVVGKVLTLWHRVLSKGWAGPIWPTNSSPHCPFHPALLVFQKLMQ
jgi:hypothetical protein